MSTPFFENFERAAKVSNETKPAVVQYTLIQLLQAGNPRLYQSLNHPTCLSHPTLPNHRPSREALT